MEDYILREINRIGELIAALLDKIGLLKKSGAPELIRETAKTELAWPPPWPRQIGRASCRERV